MASVPTQPSAAKKGRGFRPSLRIDMTPMVDLGFLLITFFVFTAAINSQAAMALHVPKDGPPTEAPESATLTVLLGRTNTVVAYSGMWEDAVAGNRVQPSGYSVANGIGAIIRQKKQQLAAAGKPASDLIVLVKPTEEASYKNVVDMLDEMAINTVTRYALVAPTDAETAFMAQHAAAGTR